MKDPNSYDWDMLEGFIVEGVGLQTSVDRLVPHMS